MKKSSRFERQSFLGPEAQAKLGSVRVGIVGAGGGGSHIVQQLAHIGFQDFVIFDPDIVEDRNLNRLVGGRTSDAKAKRLKIEVSRRLIRELDRKARVEAFPTRWEDNQAALVSCDLAFSCLDSFAARRDLEAVARRHLIPLIDIGIDVHPMPGRPPALAGQVILSMPGWPCMQCLGFLSKENLEQEAREYGAAGGRPQVVWPNGVVASTAIGLAVDLITDWTQSLRGPVYLSYDGNRGTILENSRLAVAPKVCSHYPLENVGAPVFKII